VHSVRMMRALPLSVLAAAAALLAGCGDGEAPKAAKLVVKAGGSQTAFAGQELKKPLRVQVLGKRVPGLLGGKGSEPLVGGVTVEFRVRGAAGGAVLSRSEVVTDEGGEAETKVTLGRSLGDVFVEARVKGSPEVRAVTFRIASGIRVYGGGQDGHTGEVLENPVGVEVRDSGGAPLKGVQVVFLPTRKGAGRLSRSEVLTDDDGRAESDFTLGPKSGSYEVDVVVISPRRGIAYRPVRISAFALDVKTSLITVIGGLAIFIFGMKLLSDGLQKVAGEKLRAALQLFARNRFIGMATGAAVTGIIQSSSATTVMLVGFLNAGLLQLEQALGVILGANIGTTVTAQMIAFNLKTLALPAIAIGVAINLIAKRKGLQFWGQAIAGFGILFLGLTTMSAVLKPLSKSNTIMELIGRIDCAPGPDGGMSLAAPIVAIAFGTLVTVLVQSSSASIGLLMAAASSGLINFWTAVPILLGDNIGTTITAHLAAIGGGTAAKRAAVAHSIFNMAGALTMFCLFFVPWPGSGHPIFLELVNKMTAGDGFGGENIERHIANTHSLFNVLNALIFLPLLPVLAWVVKRAVKATGDPEEEIIYLEPHLLDTPALALERAVAETVFMARLARKSIGEAYGSFARADLAGQEALVKREDKIDKQQEEITNYLVRLTQQDMREVESRQLPLLIHTVYDLERIGDHAENLTELTELRIERGLSFSDKSQEELDAFARLVDDMFGHVIEAVEKADPRAAKAALECEHRINAMEDKLQHTHQKRLVSGECDVISGVVFLDMVANLEKVGDHLTNVAEAFEASREWRDLAPAH